MQISASSPDKGDQLKQFSDCFCYMHSKPTRWLINWFNQSVTTCAELINIQNWQIENRRGKEGKF